MKTKARTKTICSGSAEHRACHGRSPEQGGLSGSGPLGHGRCDMGGKGIVDIGPRCVDTARDCRRPWWVVRWVRGLQNRRLFLLVELLKRVEQLENLCKLGVRRAAHSGDAAAMLRLI